MRRARFLALVGALALVATACHSGSHARDDGRTSSSVSAPTGSTTSTTAASLGPAIALSTQGDELDAYATTRPFTDQVVVPSPENDRDGVDVSGQICLDPTDPNRFVAVDRTAEADGQIGWGVFELSGTSLGKLKASESTRLVPTFQRSSDSPAPFGCAFLPDGRLLTTDLGNRASGATNGQLVEWFPPLDRDTVASCKVAVTLAAPEGVLVDGERVLVAESRGHGITSFVTATLPTSARATGGCAQRDATHAPLALGVVQTPLLANGSASALANAAAIARGHDGHLFVSSPRNGLIVELTASGQFVRIVLAPTGASALGSRPFATGTPMGLAFAPDGALYYADPGLERRGSALVAGVRTGTVRRIAFVNGKPLAPEVVGSGLQNPEGVGVWTPPS